jgi:hypothetical protein
MFYRFKHLKETILCYFIKHFEKIKYSLIDATGFGFDDSFNLKMLRGKELRKVKSCVTENKMLFNLLQNILFLLDLFLLMLYILLLN